MRKKFVAALAVMLIAAGVITIVTVASVSSRSGPASIGDGGTSGSDAAFVAQPEPTTPAVWMTDFTLTERSGLTFDSTAMEGKVWVASFFFTSCTMSCKDQNAHLYRLQKEWGPRGVTFVSITCDPETDGTARLREYADEFDADSEHWLFLTGDLEKIQRVGAEVFGVGVRKGVHMDRFTLVDKWGKIRGQFNWHDPLKRLELEQSLEKLLAETEPTSCDDSEGADDTATDEGVVGDVPNTDNEVTQVEQN